MKLVILVPDGMPDQRYGALGNCSPAEYADTPGMDEIVRRGQVGLVKTMYAGLPLGSLVGILGILGYTPANYFPLGRSIFEARAKGIALSANDLCCRCNIVRVNTDDVLTDFTSGQISDAVANAFLATIKLPEYLEIHHDSSYRSILIYRDAPFADESLELREPHENVGNAIATLLPRYEAKPFEPFIRLMLESRRDGLMLWPWGPGRLRVFPPVPYRLFTVTALSFLYGLSISLGGQALIPPETTGYLGSNFKNKLNAALTHLADYDVCLIHCNAPDEEAHINSPQGKVKSLEEIDQQIVVPLIERLEQCGEPYRILLCPDHYTVCGNGRHTADLVPYAIAGTGLVPNHTLTGYSETAIQSAVDGAIESRQLISRYYQGNSRS